MSPRDRSHPVDGRRRGGYRYGVAANRPTGGGGKPPRKRSCPITLLLLPLLLLAALWRTYRTGGTR